MKINFEILAISAGTISDNGMQFANAIVLDEEVAEVIEKDRIDFGQKHAKVKISTANNNRLAQQLALSGMVPGMVTCEVKQVVKKGEIALEIVNFEQKPKG